MLSAWIISTVAMVIIGVVISQPLELREGRWIRILMSIPPANVIAFSYIHIALGFISFFMIWFLALLWRGQLAHIFAGPILKMTLEASDTPYAQLKRAKMAYEDGELKEAIAFARIELKKEPSHPETLLFLARALRDDSKHEEAIELLARVAKSPEATDAQKARAAALVEDLKTVLALRKLESASK